MNAMPDLFSARDGVYRELQRRATPSPNADWLARMAASWCVGEGVLPDHMGLAPEAFREMMELRFPDFQVAGTAPSGHRLDFSRMLEKDDLVRLLGEYCVCEPPEREWIIDLLVAGCLGGDHLWQDLGLFARSDLSALISTNFPGLAGRNSKDMKWKKFLYKQLCEAEGIYVCRSPTCEACADFVKCYGPED
jgi:nitrogen fixation protein NifQ